jgi:hypothetical protein
MPGLDPGIHAPSQTVEDSLDCRVKPGNDNNYSCMGHLLHWPVDPFELGLGVLDDVLG